MNKFDAKKLISTLVFLIVVVGAGIGIYNYYNVYQKNLKPVVEITRPSKESQVSESQIVLEGTVKNGNNIKVNDTEVKIDSKGKFTKEVPLAVGVNIVTIEATSKNGQKTKSELRITRVVPVALNNNQIAKSVPTPKVVTSGSLTDTGPDNFWLPEASMLAAAGTVYLASRKKLKKMN